MSNARPPAMSDPRTRPPVRSGRRLVEVLLVIFLLVLGTAVLMPTLRSAKHSAQEAYMTSRDMSDGPALSQMTLPPAAPEPAPDRRGAAGPSARLARSGQTRRRAAQTKRLSTRRMVSSSTDGWHLQA